MLPERYRELLTAYVDGELSARQRRHALRLLRRSVEARRLLHRLQSDSDALIHLPRVHPDRDLSGAVLQKIAAARPLPIRPARRFARPRAYPAWVGAAAAAAALFLIGTASYCFFTAVNRGSSGPALVQNGTNSPVKVSDLKPPADGPHDAPPPRSDPEHDPHPGSPTRPPVDDVVQHHSTEPNPPPGAEKDEPIFTSQGMEVFPELKSLPSAEILSTFKVHELDEKKLLAALPKDALHIELPVPDANRAFERLQGVLKAHHVDLVIDATAEARLGRKNPKSQTNYILYTEDLTADELTQLLQQLGVEDRKAAEKKPAEGAFDALVVHAMNEQDHKVLKALMGVDPTAVVPSKEAGPLGVDVHKPLSDKTADQVVTTLPAGKPRAATDHPMLVLPYNPVLPKHDSAEIKRFLEDRKPLRPGALQVLLVLRNPSKS